MAGPAPSTQTVLDLLALAFSRSALREGMTRELLAERLEPAWDTFFRNDVLFLERVWDIARERPDFDAKKAAVPLCFFKTQERRLGVMVELPADLKHLSATDQATHAALCPVKRDELDQILGSAGRSLTPPPIAGRAPSPLGSAGRSPSPLGSAGRSPAPVEADAPASSTSRRLTPAPAGRSLTPVSVAPVSAGAAASPPNRRRRAVIAGVLVLAAAGFLGVSVTRSCGGGPSWEPVGTAEFKGIPVREPQRLGNQVIATLTDETWLEQPEEVRGRQLIDVLEGLSKRNVDVVALRGADARVRASVQWGGSPRRAVVKFPR